METRRLPLGFWLALAGALLAANVSVYRAVFAEDHPQIQTLEVTGGTVTLVQEGDRVVLIDTGPDASILRALGEALPMWQRDIRTIILTSDKAAQAGGLASVEGRYQVGEVIRAGTIDLPYGTTLSFGDTHITVTAPGKCELK